LKAHVSSLRPAETPTATSSASAAATTSTSQETVDATNSDEQVNSGASGESQKSMDERVALYVCIFDFVLILEYFTFNLYVKTKTKEPKKSFD
jgi:hypothetical protein